MFAAVNLELPHQLGFKCTPEDFAELTERDGIVPAPYLARAMWVQERELGAALERRELATLLRSAYDVVVAKLPKSKRPGAPVLRAKQRTKATKLKPRGGPKRR
jgi:predicted DNA-binding protein (MmcQ/YjbR family)